MNDEAARNRLLGRIASALFWIAAFCFAFALFLSLKRIFRDLPATDPVAIGLVTVEGVSKLRDYATAMLYYALVPLATVGFARWGRMWLGRLTAPIRGELFPAILFFTAPFFVAPFFYLTTRKEGWAILLPPLLAFAGTRALVLYRTRYWLRALFVPALGPLHGLLIAEAYAWLLFRYIAVGKRIAHIPTLFLELIFVAFFVLLFWLTAVYLARLGALVSSKSIEAFLGRIAVGASPLLLLPVAALFPGSARALILSALAFAILITLQAPEVSAARIRLLVAWAAIPALLFVMSYAASASLTEWIDLFHRGETLGPASDYLRGKTPYLGVFPLHGMLEDGLLDAWLMEIFGRYAEVSANRAIAISALTVPALWCLALVIFDSMPIAAVVAAVSFMTYLQNQRALLEIVVVALLIAAVRRSSKRLTLIAGAIAALALFFSLEIGIYSILAGIASLTILRRGHLVAYGLGIALGAAPFSIYLLVRGAFVAFLETSFVTIPRVIDAAWSLPFPDLASLFQHDLTLRTLADFILGERIAYILNPLVIAVALTVIAARVVSRTRAARYDEALLVTTMFALVTQRSALGRADFQHQYFSAFLYVPIVALLIAMTVERLAPDWRSRDRTVQAFFALVSFLAIPLVVAALWIPDLLNVRLDSMIGYRLRLALDDPGGAVTRNRIGAVGTEIVRLTRPNEPIFDFSNQPAFYFFAGRPNPTRFYQMPIASPLPFQIEAIRDLEKAKPRVVLRRSPEGYDRFDGLENDLRAPALAAYLDDRYRFYKKVHGVELWTRSLTQPFELQRYVRAHRLPDPTARSAAEWSIFPAVGSLAGAAGAYWRSDLVIHNPHVESVPVRLRYISTRGAFERRLTIAPSSIAHYPDVVQGLFQATGSRGTLRIEHPVDRKPIMTVKSYDSSRQGRGAIERPLSLREAATAGTARDELTIVGVDGVGVNRLNLGIINIGDIPLRVRITNTTADGTIVGEPVDAVIEEDVSHLFVDAASALGTPIDESITTHIRVLEGTAIAYASVIDTPTGDHQVVQAIPTKAVDR